MNKLENFYNQFFHQCMIITEQNEKEKNPLFELTYDTQLHHARICWSINTFYAPN
jgi:hypothetical protein